MKRRDFLAKSTLAAGLASSPVLLTPILAGEAISAQSAQTSKRPAILSAEYLRRAREDKFLPKLPVYVSSSEPGSEIAPMPIEERIRRGIVPRRGFCST
ncbi:MAG TPA: hypothetical protein VJU82_10660, partial [Acidobacteriaceae bacterium]|nr:hypothetical protein [Acidobacteriaceae bacterium]